MSMIFGTGYLRVEYGAGSVDLPYSYGDLSWVDEEVLIRTLGGKELRYYDGSRAKIKCVIMHLYSDSGVMDLMQLLNSARLSQEPVRVYPRYNGANSRSYLCQVPKDFSPQRLGLVALGQKLDLSFEGYERHYGVPVYDETTLALVKWNSHSGAQMQDHLGRDLEFLG